MSRQPFDGTTQPSRERAARDEQFRVVNPDAKSDSTRSFDLAPTAAGDITLQHGLGRMPQGWRFESMRDAFVDLFEVSRDTKQITINSSGAARFTVKIW